LVETEAHFILVDTCTDFRRQALREGIPRVDAVLFTHTPADHINGIDDLRGFHFLNRKIIPCYASPETLERAVSTFTYIFDGLSADGYSPLLEPVPVEGAFELFGCRILPVPINHGPYHATGYRFGDAAYITDCSVIPESSMALLEGLDLLIIDALRYTPHPHHLNIDGALSVVERLRPRRTVFTHLTHEVLHQDGERLPEGVEFAYDGMYFEL
jgi:phosphoribosyl 1,2-cyclic phosphate phosphodiesterase